MLREVLTIGVYGFDAASFVASLQRARADLVVDIRARRGVRGARYSFANATRLRQLLEEAGLDYIHVPQLAPLDATRQAQYQADERAGVGKRDREALSPAFVEDYRASRLNGFDALAFVRSVCATAQRPALLCVEREPGACHRSLVAAEITRQLDAPVRHLMP
jgi:uncharacterized protein (DUF488 family)